MTIGTKSERSERALAVVDSMSPELRACVHEFGYAIVRACLDAKVTEPRHIRQLVCVIWEGARQPAQRRERLGVLDWLLLQAGAQISAATLLRVLDANNMAIVPLLPSQTMVEASLAELADHSERVTKWCKHQRRIIAAVKAGAVHLRPQLLAGHRPLSDLRGVG